MGGGRRLPRAHRRHGLPAARVRSRPAALLTLPARPAAERRRRGRRQLELRAAHGQALALVAAGPVGAMTCGRMAGVEPRAPARRVDARRRERKRYTNRLMDTAPPPAPD